MTTTYISIDVATKSLAVGIYKVASIDKLRTGDGDYLCSCVMPLSMKVHDINDGLKVKDTSIITKAKCLKEVLNQVGDEMAKYEHESVLVLIEYQMNANHLSNAILNMIVYHFVDLYPVEIIRPSWKNTIALREDLVLAGFLATKSSNYRANKAHTRENMIHLLTTIGKLDHIKDIKKSNYDDIADTLCQMLAHAIRC